MGRAFGALLQIMTRATPARAVTESWSSSRLAGRPRRTSRGALGKLRCTLMDRDPRQPGRTSDQVAARNGSRPLCWRCRRERRRSRVAMAACRSNPVLVSVSGCSSNREMAQRPGSAQRLDVRVVVSSAPRSAVASTLSGQPQTVPGRQVRLPRRGGGVCRRGARWV